MAGAGRAATTSEVSIIPTPMAALSSPARKEPTSNTSRATAGSSTITVEVKDGGLGLIRVTDDGEGMSRRDASLAFERHATSKLQSDQQLGAIRTMGFRGEALPSIAAVSKVRLTTLSRQEQVGTQLWLTAGTITRVEIDTNPVENRIRPLVLTRKNALFAGHDMLAA